MSLPRHALSAAALALAAVGFSAPSASAKPVDSFDYVFDDSWVSNSCGFPMQIDAHFTGHQTVKNATPSSGGQMFRFSTKYRNTAVYTNLDNGRTVTEVDAGNFREGPAQVISDDGRIVRFRTKDSGAALTVYDADGTVLLKDRGTVVTEYTYDTLGDGVPGGEFLSDELVRVSGPHPSWDTDGCTLLTDWLT